MEDDALRAFRGVLGHFHVQTNKIDPGPAFDWEGVAARVRKMREEEETLRAGLKMELSRARSSLSASNLKLERLKSKLSEQGGRLKQAEREIAALNARLAESEKASRVAEEHVVGLHGVLETIRLMCVKDRSGLHQLMKGALDELEQQSVSVKRQVCACVRGP